MQTTKNTNCINFQGKFLSEKTVTRAIEKSKKNFIERQYNNGAAFDKTALADFDTKGAAILQSLKTLAGKLPDDFDLVLEKTTDACCRDAFCLNMRHEGLDDVEVFGEIRFRHHAANVRKNFMNCYSLEGIETAIEGLELLNPREMVSKYVSFISRRLKNAIEDGKTRKLQKKLAVVDDIAKNNWISPTAKTERTGIDSKLAEIKEQKKNRREITLFRLKRAFGLEK